MGVIAAVTPKGDIHDGVIISRPNKLIPVKEVVARKGIPIQYYDETKNLLDCVKLKPRTELLLPCTQPQSIVLDQLWTASTFNRKLMQPMLSGFMQNISQGVHQEKAKILTLSIIDLNHSHKKRKDSLETRAAFI